MAAQERERASAGTTTSCRRATTTHSGFGLRTGRTWHLRIMLSRIVLVLTVVVVAGQNATWYHRQQPSPVNASKTEPGGDTLRPSASTGSLLELAPDIWPYPVAGSPQQMVQYYYQLYGDSVPVWPFESTPGFVPFEPAAVAQEDFDALEAADAILPYDPFEYLDRYRNVLDQSSPTSTEAPGSEQEEAAEQEEEEAQPATESTNGTDDDGPQDEQDTSESEEPSQSPSVDETEQMATKEAEPESAGSEPPPVDPETLVWEPKDEEFEHSFDQDYLQSVPVPSKMAAKPRHKRSTNTASSSWRGAVLDRMAYWDEAPVRRLHRYPYPHHHVYYRSDRVRPLPVVYSVLQEQDPMPPLLEENEMGRHRWEDQRGRSARTIRTRYLGDASLIRQQQRFEQLDDDDYETPLSNL